MKTSINYKTIAKQIIDNKIENIYRELVRNFNKVSSSPYEFDVDDIPDYLVNEILKRMKHTTYKKHRFGFQYDKAKKAIIVSVIAIN